MWKVLEGFGFGLICLMLIKSNSAVKLCNTTHKVDKTNGMEYFEETRNITACERQAEICILKCCAHGKGYVWKNKTCVPTAGPFRFQSNEYLKVSKIVPGNFQIHYHKPWCKKNETRVFLRNLPHHKSEIRCDGQLYIEVETAIPPWVLLGPDLYCVDTFIFEYDTRKSTRSVQALIFDVNGEQHYVIISICMLISCVFILATVAVYGWLPELRNLHGRVLMTYLLCLFVGFVGMATMQILLKIDNIGVETCLGLSIMTYFALLAAFFWLNVMCFDIWWTFSGKRGVGAENMSLHAKFTAYSVYAFGFPTALTILMVSLEFSGLPPHPLLPLLRHQGCFLAGKSRLLYLYGPIVILWFANMVFFLMTAVKIAQIKKQVSVLKGKGSARHDQKEQQRFLLYIKLFIVMGINWLLEVISALYPKADYIWQFVDSYNVLIGLIIFIIFVCKRKIFNLMKKRYALRRGDQLSKSKASSRTLSTRDEMALSTRN